MDDQNRGTPPPYAAGPAPAPAPPLPAGAPPVKRRRTLGLRTTAGIALAAAVLGAGGGFAIGALSSGSSADDGGVGGGVSGGADGSSQVQPGQQGQPDQQGGPGLPPPGGQPGSTAPRDDTEDSGSGSSTGATAST